MNMTGLEHDVTAAKVRSRVYRLLADGFSQVDEKQYQVLKSEYIMTWKNISEFLDEGNMLDPFIERLNSAISSLDFEELTAEHSRLFEPRSKLQVPPYETEYTLAESPQHALSQPAHLSDISGFYKAFGLAVSEERPDRVDHIATELEFMHIMALKESVAIEGNETEHIEIVRDAQLKFMNDHLGRWTGQFRDRMADADEDGFYITLAEMLNAWVNLDMAYLNS